MFSKVSSETNLQGITPQDARERYPKLIDIGKEGDFALSGPFQAAIDDAQKTADDWTASHTQTQRHHAHRG